MESNFLIRRARTPDLDRVLTIERASFGAEAYDRNLFAEFLAAPHALFLLAERRGLTAGYVIAALRPSGGSAELVSIAIHPRARRMGAASILLASAIRRLKRRRVERLTLMVKTGNGAARAFYARFGFRPVRRVPGYYEDGADGLAMRKDL
jgi:ribosomal-protein-alanine N-acetyltransferase